MTCVLCHGATTIADVHVWSDGPGMVEVRCPLCDGTGEAADPVAVAIDAKRRLREAEGLLRDLRVAAALYVSIVETGRLPEPALADATRPSPHARTWRDHLVRATATLPRVAVA